MGATMDLERKWTDIRETRDNVEAYDRSQATPDSFILVFDHRSGDGPDAVDVTGVGAFEDAGDCVAYLRYYELPELLMWRTTFEQPGQGRWDLEDTALGEEEAGVDELVASLETVLGSDPTTQDLEETSESSGTGSSRPRTPEPPSRRGASWRRCSPRPTWSRYSPTRSRRGATIRS